MAKSTGLGHRLLVGGTNVSGDVTALDEVSGSVELLECTGIDKSAYERIGGLRDGMISATTWFNPTVGATHDVFAALPTTDVQVSYLTGSTVGDAAASMIAKQSGYAMSRGDDGSLTADVEAIANGYGLEWGKLLTPGIRTDIGKVEGAASTLDNAASTALGLQIYLHVTAFTAGTSATASILVQGSADNVSWATTLYSFTGITAATASRVAVAGTIPRYLRVVSTTPSGVQDFTSLSYVVSAVRNLTETVF